ncbi:MAG: cell division protein FtsL [Gammaproteobacteria bacterium]|nr:cell division protein FtsL [Gammaproteobacteria bacterium]MDD9824194.1 cell division protein FtsL [Gammaproteobacteria bacterium]MDD9863981.1 cell division protein FtsL [Gammaproteobacteria bacterium]
MKALHPALLPWLLGLAIFLTAVLIVWSRHEARRLFVEMQQLERDRDALNEQWGRLQLERSTWADHGRIERLARTRIGMGLPREEVLVILRGGPEAAPGRRAGAGD